MDNKTKVKVAVVIGIVILAIIFIFMVIFVKGNRNAEIDTIPTKKPGAYVRPGENTTNKVSNNSTKNNSGEKVSLDEIESLGIKDNCLVKIDSSLKSTTIKELGDEYISFCYGDSKAYIANKNGDNSCSILEIDLLKSDYPSKEVFSTDEYGTIDDLDYYGGKLYFVTENRQIIEYSIEENFMRALTNEDEASHFIIDKEKNLLYASYRPNGENCGIYVLNFTENTFDQIANLEDLTGELVLNENALVIDAYGELYIYNFELNEVFDIGGSFGKTSLQVVFYENNLLYTDGSKIDIKDCNGNSSQDNWYDLGDNSISSISMITTNKLQIARRNEDGVITKSIIIDLTNGSATENKSEVYSELVIIK